MMTSLQITFAQAVQIHKAGNLRRAELLYRQVLDADPGHVPALTNLGALYIQLNRHQDAIEPLRRALALRPGIAESHSNLAAAYQATGKVLAAIAEFREALWLQPTAAPIHVNLGQALLDMGQRDEALALGAGALRLQPGYPPAYGLMGALAAHGRHTLAAEDIRQMQALLAAGRLAADHAVLLHFTLAAYWEQQGDHDRAFTAYRGGNDLKREIFRNARRSFDQEQHRARIDTFMAAFTPDFFERARTYGVLSERPTFVVGMVRSGTSLVEHILASHPQVFGCGELSDMDRIANSFYPACINGADPATLKRLAELYLKRLAHLSCADAVRVIDKMPGNFLHLGVIAVLFPRARVVHCRRDPLDGCVSAYVQNFQRLPYTTSLEDLGFFHRHYERLMEHWHRVLPLPMFEVRYEELVVHPERVTRELVAFCGLSWDDRCLAFHNNPRAVQTASRLQVRQPIYTHAVARWKRFDAHLQPLRDALAGRS